MSTTTCSASIHTIRAWPSVSSGWLDDGIWDEVQVRPPSAVRHSLSGVPVGPMFLGGIAWMSQPFEASRKLTPAMRDPRIPGTGGEASRQVAPASSVTSSRVAVRTQPKSAVAKPASRIGAATTPGGLGGVTRSARVSATGAVGSLSRNAAIVIGPVGTCARSSANTMRADRAPNEQRTDPPVGRLPLSGGKTISAEASS